MQLKLSQFFVATSVIFALLNLAPIAPWFSLLFVFLIGGWDFAYFVPQRKFLKHGVQMEHPVLEPRALFVLFVCTVFIGLAFVWPINLELLYHEDGWRIERWLYPQILCYCFSLIFLNWSQLEVEARFGFFALLSTVYAFTIPLLILKGRAEYFWD